MELQTPQTRLYKHTFHSYEIDDRERELTQKRLETLLSLNEQTAREKAVYRSAREKFEAESMTNPVAHKEAFAFLGLLLGAFPPAAILARFFLNGRIFRREDAWILGLLIAVNLVSAAVGYFSGKLIGTVVRESEKLSWTKMILLLPFVGILWGILAGGAGGLAIFIIGAFFGAFLGAMVGSVALPLFTVFHRSLKRGDMIELKHLLPLAFGTSLAITAFILGA